MKSTALFVFLTGVSLICISCEPRSPAGIGQKQGLTIDELLASFGDARLRSEGAVRHVINNAANSPFSVSYIHLDWSAHSATNQRIFAPFILNYSRLHPDREVLFHFVDCTSITSDYSPLYELDGWDTSKHRIEGYGEVLWMRDGRVIHFEKISNFASSEKLVQTTDALFGMKDDKRMKSNG